MRSPLLLMLPLISQRRLSGTADSPPLHRHSHGGTRCDSGKLHRSRLQRDVASVGESQTANRTPPVSTTRLTSIRLGCEARATHGKWREEGQNGRVQSARIEGSRRVHRVARRRCCITARPREPKWLPLHVGRIPQYLASYDVEVHRAWWRTIHRARSTRKGRVGLGELGISSQSTWTPATKHHETRVIKKTGSGHRAGSGRVSRAVRQL